MSLEKDILGIFNNNKNKLFSTGQIVKIVDEKWDDVLQVLFDLGRRKKIYGTYYYEETVWGMYATILEFDNEIARLETEFLYTGDETYIWET